MRDVVVIGGSAGAMKALQTMVAHLPVDLPAAVVVVTHLAPAAPSRLAAALTKAGPLPAVEVQDGMRMVAGQIYTAASDRHLVLDRDDVLRLSRGPRQNRVRPAVDALFRSAARWCGPRVIAVVLSGSLDDGAAGLAAVQRCGGAALVQDPREAAFHGMPQAALAAVPEAEVLPAVQLARRVAELAGRHVEPPKTEEIEALIWETDMIRDGRSADPQAGWPTGLGCPECGGGMNTVPTGRALLYVCHAGHSYSPETFLAARDDTIEAAVWTVLSGLQEKAAVLKGLAARSDDQRTRRRYIAAALSVTRAAELVREQLLSDEPDQESRTSTVD